MQFYFINIRPKLHHQKWWKLHVTLPVNMSTVRNFTERRQSCRVCLIQRRNSRYFRCPVWKTRSW